MSEYVNAHMIQMVRKLLAGRKVLCVEFDPLERQPHRSEVDELELLPTKTIHDFNVSTFKGHPIYWKDIKIPEYIIEQRPLILAKEIAALEDYIVFQGGDHDGAIHHAENTHSQVLDFGINGNATKVAGWGLTMLEHDGYDTRLGASMILNKVQFQQLLVSFDHYGIPECNTIKNLLSGGDILMTNVPEGEGMIVAKEQLRSNRINLYMDWKVEIMDITTNTHRIYASFDTEFKLPQMMCRVENI